MTDGLGAEFARALAAKDSDRLLELMHPEIDFRGLTPNRNWEASDRDSVLSVLLDEWFEDKDLSAPDGQIEWMRVLCSGYRPAASAE